MLFKRVLEGKSTLTKKMEKERRTEYEVVKNILNNPNIFEEIMKIIMVFLSLWAAYVYGSMIMPYPLNFIISADIKYPPPQYKFPFPSEQALQCLPAVEEKHMNISLKLATSSLEKLANLEARLRSSGVLVALGSPAHGQRLHSRASAAAMQLHKYAWTVTKASKLLSYQFCESFGVNEDECASYIGKLHLRNGVEAEACRRLYRTPCSEARQDSPYRSMDGSCNTPRLASRGSALTGFRRLLHPSYGRGFDDLRRSVANKALVLARDVTSAVAADVSAPDSRHSLALGLWTQFLEHDLVHVPMSNMFHSGLAMSCCDQHGGSLPPRHRHPECLTLEVSRMDPFYGPQWVSCLSYARSITTFRSDCTFGAAEQMNQATHFHDGSHIYGTSPATAVALRQKSGGLLKVEDTAVGTFLPQVSLAKEHCQVENDNDVCFFAADARTNSHPHMAALHTVWVREHNRIATHLSLLNPAWGDDKLYQQARRIVVAQLQHITYAHWLPEIIGKSTYETHFSDTSYRDEADSTVSNAFATAAVRFASSTQPGTVELLAENRIEGNSSDLSRHYYRPALVREAGGLAGLLRGATARNGEQVDLHFPDDITEELYAAAGQNVGLDSLSLDIQRGRDHGLPPYHQYRTLCGLRSVEDFQDLDDVIPQEVINKLKKLYAHVHDVDLTVGALAEKPQGNAVVGPTFACLLGEQLLRTRGGDRYFYSNLEQPEPFTSLQLAQLQKANLARIFCDNVPDIKQLQPDVFSSISDSNQLVSCKSNEIKRVNLAAWEEPSHRLDIISRTKRTVDRLTKVKPQV